MTVRRSANTDRFNELMTRLNHELANEAKNNLLSQAVHVEEVYKRILNSLFGWSLHNLNSEENNAPAIDLIDEENKIAVQISVSATRRKVESTLDKEPVKKLAKEGFRIKFVACGTATFPDIRTEIKNPYNIAFDYDKDCLETSDLVGQFMRLDVPKQEETLHILRQELGEEFMLTQKLIRDNFESAKKELGGRYSPELTVSIDESDYFDVILNPAEVVHRISSGLLDLRECAEELYNELGSNSGSRDDVVYAVSDLVAASNEAEQATTPESLDKVVNAYYDFEYKAFCSQDPIKRTREVNNVCHSLTRLSELCGRDGFSFFGKTFLIVTGRGGVGKSHLLADYCSRAIDTDHAAFLVLGQSFVKSADPLEQLSGFISSSHDYQACLSEIERYAAEREDLALIAIDALNEGDGKGYWINHLQRFLDEMEKYPHIRIVVSVRSSYIDQTIPKEFEENNETVASIELKGFESSSEAIDAFCEYYGIEPPAFPPYGDEYTNPLFLKTLCRAISGNGVGGFELNLSFLSAIKICLKHSNTSVSNALDCPEAAKIVEKAIVAIVSDAHFSKSGYLTYDEANEAIVSALSSYTSSAYRVLGLLEAEGILRIDKYGDDSIVSFEYERFGDAIEASTLIETAIKGCDEPVEALRKSEALSNALNSGVKRGVAEALGALLPELAGVEVFEFLDLENEIESDLAFDLFVDSIPWRKDGCLKEAARAYIKAEILEYPNRLVEFMRELAAVAMSPSSAFNANLLHELLSSMDPQERDGVWAHALYENQVAIKSIVWFWKNFDKAADSVVPLAAKFLSWCTASTSRMIRDCATKALSMCFLRQPSLLTYATDIIVSVNDDYMIERVIAAVYGAASNYKGPNDAFVSAADEVYSFVYGGDETYPNIMVRNYAGCLLDLIVRNFDREKSSYPLFDKQGKSAWYQKPISNEDIDKVLGACEDEHGRDSEYATNLQWLIHSMTTEYGRGTCRYGDFGRYVFGGLVYSWKADFPNDQDLANLVLNEILGKRYDPKWHCSYDRLTRHYDQSQTCGYERLTKKYQWIETFRLLARLVDNYPPYKEEFEYDDEYRAAEDEAAKRFEIALKTGDFESFGRNELDPRQHVVSTKRNYLTQEEVFYELEHVRDIDPTHILPPVKNDKKSGYVADALRELSGTAEYDRSSIGSSLMELHETIIDGVAYVLLWTRTNIKSPNETAREVHWETSAGFVPNSLADGLLSNYNGSHGNDCLSGETIHIYCREFNASRAFDLDQGFRAMERGDEPNIVTAASFGYMWEPVDDGSALDNESVFIQYPSIELCDAFSLRQDDLGSWTDGNRIVCYEVPYSNGSCLLFRKDCLMEYLQKTGMTLIWGEYFEITSLTQYRQRIWFMVKSEPDGNLVFSEPEKDSFVLSEFPWFRGES